jgi:hypothetical protein
MLYKNIKYKLINSNLKYLNLLIKKIKIIIYGKINIIL